MKFAGTYHTSQVIALLINNAGINVKTERGVGGGGTGKGAAFDSLPPTTRLPAEPALLNPTCNFQSGAGGGGGYFWNFWVGICGWDTGTLNRYQS